MLGEKAERYFLQLGEIFEFLSPRDPHNQYYVKAKEACRKVRLARSEGTNKAAAAAEQIVCPHCGKNCADEGSCQSHLFDLSGKSHPVYDFAGWCRRGREAGRWPCEYCWKVFAEEDSCSRISPQWREVPATLLSRNRKSPTKSNSGVTPVGPSSRPWIN